MCCHAKKKWVVAWRRSQKGEGRQESGQWRAWERWAINVNQRRNGGGVVGNRYGYYGMYGHLYAVYGRARGVDKTLATVCMHNCTQCTGSQETAATCLARGGACGRSLGATSRKHTHANEVAALSPDRYSNSRFCNVVGTAEQWKGREKQGHAWYRLYSM
jgi:hypothetical protein